MHNNKDATKANANGAWGRVRFSWRLPLAGNTQSSTQTHTSSAERRARSSRSPPRSFPTGGIRGRRRHRACDTDTRHGTRGACNRAQASSLLLHLQPAPRYSLLLLCRHHRNAAAPPAASAAPGSTRWRPTTPLPRARALPRSLTKMRGNRRTHLRAVREPSESR